MFRLIKQVPTTLISFSGSLASLAKVSDRTKFRSFNNQPSKTTLADLNPDEYNQGLRYYPFMINLNRYHGSCNALNDLSSKIYVPKKAEDLNINVFNMIIGIDESKT